MFSGSKDPKNNLFNFEHRSTGMITKLLERCEYRMIRM